MQIKNSMKTAIQKTIIVMGLFFLIGNTCRAQIGFSGGLLGGVSFGSVNVDGTGESFNGDISGDNIFGFEAGLYAKLRLAPFYIRPELLYDYRNGQVTYYDNQSDDPHSDDFSVHKLEIPLLFGLHIIGPLNVEVGPVYNYLLTVTENYNSNDVNLGRNGLGWRAGVVAELGGLLLGFSYQGATYSSGSNNASFSEPYKLVLGVGVRLGSTGDPD
jgi:hypothetical protein